LSHMIKYTLMPCSLLEIDEVLSTDTPHLTAGKIEPPNIPTASHFKFISGPTQSFSRVG